jgi:ribosome-interacting GTPase 1
MPANLTPDYLAAEQSYKQAQTHQERIAALEEMIATLPKHKGTEKLHADLKRRLSRERKDSQKKGGAHSAPAWLVKREGAGQVVLVGPPNSGKSSLVCALTHAHPEVADYPFTTRMPVPGMMLFENVPIQLVDLPPVSEEFTEAWLPQIIRGASLTVLIIDPNDAGVLDELEWMLNKLESWRAPRPRFLLGNKLDLPGAADEFAAVRDLYGDRFAYLGVSALSGSGFDAFRRAMFEALDVVRFYSKPPGHKPDLDVPYILHRGETVQDAALHVHRDFAEHLKYARLFRKTGEPDGRMVERSHLVEDEDILEFHV